MVRSERNARIHLVATLVVIAGGLTLEIHRGEWLAVILAIAGVWCAEGFNSAIEELSDVVSSEPHPGIARTKDIAAGAVLIATIAAVAIAILVFGPYILGST
jgi:diacylglycerol kinase